MPTRKQIKRAAAKDTATPFVAQLAINGLPTMTQEQRAALYAWVNKEAYRIITGETPTGEKYEHGATYRSRFNLDPRP